MVTKNPTLLVTTLLTQTRDRTAEDILFQTGWKESGNRSDRANLAEITSWPITAC